MRLCVAIAFALAGLVACAGSGGGNSAEGFDLRRDSVLVLPMPAHEVEIGPLERFKDEFGVPVGGDPRSVMAAFFDSVLVEGINDTLRLKRFRRLPFALEPGTGFSVEKQVARKDEVQDLDFRLPTRGELARKGVACRYVLGVGFLELRHREGVEVGAPGLAGLVVKGSLGAMSEDHIDATFNYILWDYLRNAPVSWGIANGVPRKGTVKSDAVWGSTIRNSGVFVLKRMGLQSFFRHPPIQEPPRYGH